MRDMRLCQAILGYARFYAKTRGFKHDEYRADLLGDDLSSATRTETLEEAFPTLQRWAFVIFACPGTSCERERAFSSARKLIICERSSLGDKLIKALEYLRVWWNNGLIKRL